MKAKYIFKIILFFIFILGIPSKYVMAEQLTSALCRSKVIKAAALIESRGLSTISQIKNPTGKFRFGNGEGYLWIHNLEGKMIMHPIKTSLNGKNILGTVDSEGTYFFVAMNRIVQDHDSGWVFYRWTKQGEDETSRKVAFVKLATYKNKSYVIGSGLYDVEPEEIKKQFPKDAVYVP